jgi:hypothetical protein
MEEAPVNGKESSHSAHANGTDEGRNSVQNGQLVFLTMLQRINSMLLPDSGA